MECIFCVLESCEDTGMARAVTRLVVDVVSDVREPWIHIAGLRTRHICRISAPYEFDTAVTVFNLSKMAEKCRPPRRQWILAS